MTASDKTQAVYIRLNKELLAQFKLLQKNWRPRVNLTSLFDDAVKDYLAKHSTEDDFNNN